MQGISRQSEDYLTNVGGVSEFDDTVIAAVTGHMNDDHTDDSLLIARAFGYPEATQSVMTGLDGEGGEWRVSDLAGEHNLRVSWPNGPITERPQIRREVVFLYRAACEKLGLPWRDETAPTQGRHAAEAEPNETAATQEEPKPFSQQLREGTWSDHSDSEGSGFMEDIMRARASYDDYVALAVQHYFMYEALEAVAAEHAGDPAFAPFHPAALVRMDALVSDLEFLIGADWRDKIEAVPATAAYADRIREVGAEGWVGGIIAHHYTRYLGDLSGGQMISRRVAKQHGFDGAGVEFYAFPELGDVTEFKNRYRGELDAYGETLSATERERMVDEVRIAYRFNTEVFIDLARAKATAAA